VAVTISDEFTGFVGFRPVSEIKSFLKSVDVLRSLFNDEDVKAFLNAPEEGEETERLLKKLFSEVFHKEPKQVEASIQRLSSDIDRRGDEALGEFGPKQGLEKVVKKLLGDYPGDPGMFASVCFTNFVKLRRGEGIAVPADCIHAYLEGDVIECMARSDNMVRFCPERKFLV
jgi:mannose-6-phosphate isomerase